MSLEFLKFSVDDAFAIDGNTDRANIHRLNQQTGPGYTVVEDGKILGCGGIRTQGIGEAWALYSPEAKDRRRELLEKTRYWMDMMAREERLWRIWSEAPIAPNVNFIKHLGFEKIEAYLKG